MIRIERPLLRPPSPKRALRFPLLRRAYLLPPLAPPTTPADQRANLPLRSMLGSPSPCPRPPSWPPHRDCCALPILSPLRSSLRTRGLP